MVIKNAFWETIIGYFDEMEIGNIFEIKDENTTVKFFLRIKEIQIPLNKKTKQIYNCVNLETGELWYFHPSQKLYRCPQALIDLRPGFKKHWPHQEDTK